MPETYSYKDLRGRLFKKGIALVKKPGNPKHPWKLAILDEDGNDSGIQTGRFFNPHETIIQKYRLKEHARNLGLDYDFFIGLVDCPKSKAELLALLRQQGRL